MARTNQPAAAAAKTAGEELPQGNVTTDQGLPVNTMTEQINAVMESDLSEIAPKERFSKNQISLEDQLKVVDRIAMMYAITHTEAIMAMFILSYF